jgi:hypothetical protein
MMKRCLLGVSIVAMLAAPACAQPTLSAADTAAIYKAAGFKAQGKTFTRCLDDNTLSHSPAAIEAVDLNGDGLPEAWVREGSTYCYGDTGQAVALLRKDQAGAWKVLLDEVGMDVVEKTKTNGWPDITIGGPGMGAQPLFKFNGVKYVRAR